MEEYVLFKINLFKMFIMLFISLIKSNSENRIYFGYYQIYCWESDDRFHLIDYFIMYDLHDENVIKQIINKSILIIYDFCLF